MGEQAVTGGGASPAPEQMPDAGGEDAAADTGSGGAEPVAAGAAPAGAGAALSRTADIVPGPGGVMTDEVGVVTGELTLRTEYADGQVTLRVQYKDAAEWYAVTGGKAALADPAGLDAVHSVAVGLLHRPEG